MRFCGQMRQKLSFLAKIQNISMCGALPIPAHSILIVMYEGGSRMLWGYFSSVSTVHFVKIEGQMDGAKYREILKDNLLLSTKNLKCGRNCSIQQDNDPKSKSRSKSNQESVALFQICGPQASSYQLEQPAVNLLGRMGKNHSQTVCKDFRSLPQQSYFCSKRRFYKVETSGCFTLKQAAIFSFLFLPAEK